MARWAASAKWAAGPALDGQRDMPLALRLSEGLGISLGAKFVEYIWALLLVILPVRECNNPVAMTLIEPSGSGVLLEREQPDGPLQ